MRAGSSRARQIVFGALLVPVAFGVFSRPEAAPVSTPRAAPVVSTAAGLPPEFRAIRPADLDGGAAPIPPSELWPAQ